MDLETLTSVLSLAGRGEGRDKRTGIYEKSF